MPARVTRDHFACGQFHYWLGRSGTRYLHTVFAIDDCPEFEHALFIAVKRDASGYRQAVATGTMGTAPQLVLRGRAIADARRRGANEIHLHLMATTRDDRRAVLDDITRRHVPSSIRRHVPAPCSSRRAAMASGIGGGSVLS